MKKQVPQTQKMLNTWAIILIIWSFYRSYFRTDLPIWLDEFVAKPAIFLLPLVYYIKKYEKVPFFHALDFRPEKIRDTLYGMVIGTSVLLVFIFSLLLSREPKIPLVATTVFWYVLIAFVSSFSEELLSRGFVLKRLYEESKNTLQSVFFASFLFFFLHIPIIFSNPDIRGTMLIQVMITDLALSFGISLVYLKRKNTIVPIMIHAFYNVGLYLFILS